MKSEWVERDLGGSDEDHSLVYNGAQNLPMLLL